MSAWIIWPTFSSKLMCAKSCVAYASAAVFAAAGAAAGQDQDVHWRARRPVRRRARSNTAIERRRRGQAARTQILLIVHAGDRRGFFSSHSADLMPWTRIRYKYW